jgi:formiminotetrahydrofolate cyclodeaminase
MHTPIEKLTVSELLSQLEGDAHGSPGAGSAAAVALALAAACASKALAVSQRERGSSAPLTDARSHLSSLIRIALRAAMGDANAFAEYLETQSPESVDRLLNEQSRQKHMTLSLLSVLEDLEQSISPSMKGDWLAARELANAALAIVGENWRETQTAKVSEK